MLAGVEDNLEVTVGKRIVALDGAVTRLEKKKVKGSRAAQQTVSRAKVDVLKVLGLECI